VTDYLQKGTGTEQYELLANRIDNAVAQRRSEQRASKIERWLIELAEETTNILWIFTADMDDVIFINSAFEELYGIPIDRLRDDPLAFLDATHPEIDGMWRRPSNGFGTGRLLKLNIELTKARTTNAGYPSKESRSVLTTAKSPGSLAS